jgi:hypothetical protein
MPNIHSILPRDKNKIALKPHLEPHGNHSVEWSYHFPIVNTALIQADIDIVIPMEKAPSLARELLLKGIIAHTRFSLAVETSSVQEVTSAFYGDSCSIQSRLCGPQSVASIEELDNSPKLLRRGENYFTMGFLSRLALMHQSGLKRSARQFSQILKKLEADNHQSFYSEFSASIALLERVLRSSEQAIAAIRAWREIRKFARVRSLPAEESGKSLLERHCAELDEIAELLLGMMGKTIADAQDSAFDALDNGYRSSILGSTEELIRNEVASLSRWTTILCQLRSEFGLPCIADLSQNPEMAACHYKRSLEVKRTQYRKWDLSVDLEPVDRGVDFWIGAAAAGISALFAFFATVLIAVGFQGPNSLSFTQTGIIALSLFAGANAVIYVIKDRMKELLKVYVRKYLRLKGGRWEGACQFVPPSFEVEHNVGQKPSTVMKLSRRLWWSRDHEEWHLRISEEFVPLVNIANTPSSTMKQVWKIPLDEILHTFDDSTHVIRLPSIDGRPQHVETLKRSTLPFKISIRTKTREGKELRLLDESKLQGEIVISGSRIMGVDVDR